MGEIKSTLDIVMEKTKDLVLSKEEKAEYNINEAKKSLKGLLQKFEDKVLDREQLEQELNILQESYDLKEKNILIGEILGKLNLVKDNRPILALLHESFGIDVSSFESLFNNFQDTIYKETQKRMNVIKDNLAEKRFISGSAVFPNIEADDEWKAKIRGIKNKFAEKLGQEKAVKAN